jgi:hypothetical protein
MSSKASVNNYSAIWLGFEKMFWPLQESGGDEQQTRSLQSNCLPSEGDIYIGTNEFRSKLALGFEVVRAIGCAVEAAAFATQSPIRPLGLVVSKDTRISTLFLRTTPRRRFDWESSCIGTCLNNPFQEQEDLARTRRLIRRKQTGQRFSSVRKISPWKTTIGRQAKQSLVRRQCQYCFAGGRAVSLER